MEFRLGAYCAYSPGTAEVEARWTWGLSRPGWRDADADGRRRGAAALCLAAVGERLALSAVS